MVGEKVPVDMRDRKPEASGRIQTKPGHELGCGGQFGWRAREEEKREGNKQTKRPGASQETKRPCVQNG